MKPGRDLDKLIAEKMGWTLVEVPGSGFWYTDRDKTISLPQEIGPLHYSVRIDRAWEVVEKLNSLGFMVDVQSADGFHQVQIEKLHKGSWDVVVESTDGESVPHAICLAALRAL